MSWDFPTPEQRRKAGPLVEVMHYQAIQAPEPKPRKRFKVWTPRPRLFATLEEARAHALAYAERTGFIVGITDHFSAAEWKARKEVRR